MSPTDIRPSILGPHALANLEARKRALIAYGIDPVELAILNHPHKEIVDISHEERSLMIRESKQSLMVIENEKRALMIEHEHALVAA